jgi:hypothetical protein
MSNRGIADEQRWGVIAQAKAGRMLDSELTIRANLAGVHLQMAAQSVHQCFGSSEGADRRAAYARNGFADGLARKHRIKIDYTVDVCEGDFQGAAYFRRNRFRKPAVELLRGMQRWEKRGAALRRQLGEHRAQANEIRLRHLTSGL